MQSKSSALAEADSEVRDPRIDLDLNLMIRGRSTDFSNGSVIWEYFSGELCGRPSPRHSSSENSFGNSTRSDQSPCRWLLWRAPQPELCSLWKLVTA